MTTISAEVVLASRHAQTKHTLWTLLLRYPRWIHAEFMTHREFARNAASSRAIPIHRLIQSAIDEPAIPMFWGRNQRGMQAGEECNELVRYNSGILEYAVPRETAWLEARDQAVGYARAFAEAGYHKQIVNRLLEPFTHITVLLSTTNLANFLWLRDHEDAEPHIRLLAQRIRQVTDGHLHMQQLMPGEWHMPFITGDDWAEVNGGGVVTSEQVEAMQILSVARCASTSYKTVEGFDMTQRRALAVWDKLVGGDRLHASAFEHVAQADNLDTTFHADDYPSDVWRHRHQHGCFTGFRQLRKMMPGEYTT